MPCYKAPIPEIVFADCKKCAHWLSHLRDIPQHALRQQLLRYFDVKVDCFEQLALGYFFVLGVGYVN
jgi:hypothetical protein